MATATATKRKLVLKMSVSLDGFVAGPNGELDWIFRSSSADSRERLVDTLREAGVHIMGSCSYYDMAAFWPFSDTPFTASMNDIPKIVFSKTGIKDGTRVDRTAEAEAGLTKGRPSVTPTAAVLKSWAEPTVARGDLAEEILRLKEQPGDFILAHGGVRFAQSLIASGLIDEYRLAIHPVLLGQGQRLFGGRYSTADLHLVSATPYSGGIVGVVYRPA
ncbi:dihydrofolate reductase [Dyella monticola]|uniref:Dihydrofolate reductase n=1 Tax=Dyella monticola TaxID=1927958 RepID=A0A370WU30_9GAMM|nr:dihydrofolate reductase family protein [Dyella monticola]RDS79644.1 dihydrofolate reductase [Dyella monticola]